MLLDRLSRQRLIQILEAGGNAVSVVEIVPRNFHRAESGNLLELLEVVLKLMPVQLTGDGVVIELQIVGDEKVGSTTSVDKFFNGGDEVDSIFH